ncbi:MAG TPA: hypothetical protein VGE35_03125 [Candidatus Paceibacterota bacterium]
MDKAFIAIMVLVALIMLGGAGGSSSAPADRNVGTDTYLVPDTKPVVPEAIQASPIRPTDNSWQGEEGTIAVGSVSSGPVTIYEGSPTRIMSFSVSARGSQVYVQRVRVDLGQTKDVWLKILSEATLRDDYGTVLARVVLDNSTVSTIGGRQILTFAGFNYAVDKNATRTLHVYADPYSTIDGGSGREYAISIPKHGVRAQDGRASEIYGPERAILTSIRLQ